MCGLHLALPRLAFPRATQEYHHGRHIGRPHLGTGRVLQVSDRLTALFLSTDDMPYRRILPDVHSTCLALVLADSSWVEEWQYLFTHSLQAWTMHQAPPSWLHFFTCSKIWRRSGILGTQRRRFSRQGLGWHYLYIADGMGWPISLIPTSE